MRRNRLSWPLSILSGIIIFFVGCTGSTGGNAKTDTETAKIAKTDIAVKKGAFDTAAYLASKNISRASFSSIPDNQTEVIQATSVYFPTLQIGNNAKLVISPTLPSCDIIIDSGVFLDNAEIVADGNNGSNAGLNPGDPWIRGWWQASQSQDGAGGVPGLRGGPGGNGVPLTIILGIATLHTLNIHSNGGNGGNSGNGGKGQIGGNKNPGRFIPSNLKRSGAGGPGGPGLDGGPGGSGGYINLSIYAAVPNINLSAVSQGLTLLANKGSGGAGGSGGPGGEGGDGGQRNRSGGNGGPGPTGFFGPTQLKIYTNKDSIAALLSHNIKP